MNTPNAIEQWEANHDRFMDGYRIAWKAWGKPNHSRIFEVLVEALKEPTVEANDHALLIFMKSAIQQGAPLNWFGAYIDILDEDLCDKWAMRVHELRQSLQPRLKKVFPKSYANMFPDEVDD